jgi:RND family efflux transporter MFP subunit
MFISFFYMFLFNGCAQTQAENTEPDSTEEQVNHVRFYTVEASTKTEVFQFPALLEAQNVAILLPKSPGRISSVSVRVGQKVSEGDSLMSVEDSDYRYGVQDAKALHSVSTAQLEQAKINLSRFEQLLSSGAATQAQFEEVQIGVDLAEAQYNRTAAALGIANSRLRDTMLTAPFTGVIIERNIEVGELIGGGPTPRPPLTLANIESMRVIASVNESIIHSLHENDEVEIMPASVSNEVLTGTIERINSAVDPITRMVSIEAKIENPNERLKHGMSATLQLKTNTQNVLMIPRKALMDRENGTARVFVHKEGHVQEKRIRYAASTGELVPLIEGLSVGDQIVEAGQSRLVNGDRVKEYSQ